MPTRSDRVKAAIATCDFWYTRLNYDIRTLSERIEEMWFDVEHHLDLMEQAEQKQAEEEASQHLESIIRSIVRIQAEMRALKIRA